MKTKEDIEKGIKYNTALLKEKQDELEKIMLEIKEKQQFIYASVNNELEDDIVLGIRNLCSSLLDCFEDKENLEDEIEELKNDINALENEQTTAPDTATVIDLVKLEEQLEDKTGMNVRIEEDRVSFSNSIMGCDFECYIDYDIHNKLTLEYLRELVIREQQNELDNYLENVGDCNISYNDYEYVQNSFMTIIKAIYELMEEGEE